jgi:N-acetylglutamate synthase-like GNAT family acetyltransferase
VTTLDPLLFPLVDIALARRLERAEGMANAASVDSRRECQPGVGAEWTEVAGVYAMFDGPASPLTQTFGLGLFEPFLRAEFDRIEEFFERRDAPTFHEVSSFAPPETLALLSARGYSPIEASTVLVRPTSATPLIEASEIAVRTIEPSETAQWSRVAADAWGSESPELRDFIEEIGGVVARAHGVTCFIAEREGAPIATAALNVQSGVALLAGAATIPSARRQGAQRELLRSRLAFAAAHGIELAMVVTQPGSASQRNAERQGFRPVYTRAKWQRPNAAPAGTPS